MKHGFIKVAAATPAVTVADCRANLAEILRLHGKAEAEDVRLLVFPELCLTGYTCADLFFSDVLLSDAEGALTSYLEDTRASSLISIIGFPLVVNDKIYNCAAICQKGRILGVIPKTHLPSHGEFSEARQFSVHSGDTVFVSLCGQTVPFGSNQIFACANLPLFRFGVELCEDLWAPDAPSAALCGAGATVIANLCASAAAVGKDEYRRLLVQTQSAKTVCGYILANCGDGESTTDLVFGGHSLIADNGVIVAERPSFGAGDLLVSEIDLCRLSAERKRLTTYTSRADHSFRTTHFTLEIAQTALTRPVDAHPFIPSNEAERRDRCELVLTIQAKGLAQRIVKAYAKTCVIGISGGLDSCLALLVAAKAMDLLGRPRTDIIGVTMPCFGTTKRTRSNAELLCQELGTQLRCVDISAAVRQHFADIGHDENDHSVTYENAQARERTQVIMDIANKEGGLVVGTGDLSELALGWATYNGDHMSMYGVNGGVPKTLIRHVVDFCATGAKAEGKDALATVLWDILDTPVSPELLPADTAGNIAQKTEDLVGPYEIHDFYLYNMLRWQDTPDKLYRLAKIAFAGIYDDATLLKWLKNFIRRFFAQQFKRSCLPDGPKVGSVGLSPRGDLRMPSDASARAWLKIAEELE